MPVMILHNEHTHTNRSRLENIRKDISGVKLTPLGVYTIYTEDSGESWYFESKLRM